jgi:Gram-negative bacterial TonB protein C-terminal
MAYALFQKLALGLVCATLPVSAIAAPKEPLRLKPSSKWNSDYMKDGCRLIRQFGEGDDISLIIMNRFAPRESFSLTLAGRPFKLTQTADAKVQFGPTEAEQDVNFMAGTLGDLPSLVMSGEMRLAPASASELAALKAAEKNPIEFARINFEPLGAEREKQVKFIKVGRPLRQAVILELGAMDKPLAALDTCITDLVNSWGLDAAKHKTLTRAVLPTSNPGNWMSSGDYPIKMLRAGQPAIVEFRLDVDETGRATGCHIQQTTRPKEFDRAVCSAIMRKAKLSPALDAQGQPMKSYYQSTVRFQI